MFRKLKDFLSQKLNVSKATNSCRHLLAVSTVRLTSRCDEQVLKFLLFL